MRPDRGSGSSSAKGWASCRRSRPRCLHRRTWHGCKTPEPAPEVPRKQLDSTCASPRAGTQPSAPPARPPRHPLGPARARHRKAGARSTRSGPSSGIRSFAVALIEAGVWGNHRDLCRCREGAGSGLARPRSARAHGACGPRAPSDHRTRSDPDGSPSGADGLRPADTLPDGCAPPLAGVLPLWERARTDARGRWRRECTSWRASALDCPTPAHRSMTRLPRRCATGL